MMRAIAFLCVWACASFAAYGQSPVSIVGPKQANVGDLVILEAMYRNEQSVVRWLLVNSDKTFLPVDDGRRMVFASGDVGVYKFILIVGNVDSDSRMTLEVVEHVVAIGQSPVDPIVPVPITPNVPVPTPTFPKGKYGLAAWSYTQAMQIDVEGRSKASRIADCFSSVATLISPADPNLEGYSTVEEVLSKTIECNREAAGEQRQNWLSWFAALDAKLTELSNGRLTTLQDHKAAWNEIAEGLRSVK